MTGAIFLIIWLPGAILTRWYLLPKMDPSPGSGTQQMLKVWGWPVALPWIWHRHGWWDPRTARQILSGK
jgi:hypothetical protein